MEIVRKLEELNDGTFPCDIILSFSEKCPGSSPQEQKVCDMIKDAVNLVFEFLNYEFPTCLESFECIPDFFADICPDHIECSENELPNRALKINTNDLNHEFIDKTDLDTSGILTRGSMYSYYGNKHYFFGGEDVRLDKNRIFEKNVVYLDTDGFTRTEIDLPEYNASMNMLYKGFARGASAIHQGKVWICGVGFAPKSCYKFSGKHFDSSEKMLNIGHTDYSSLLSTSQFGLLISGGRTEVAYPERDWILHSSDHSVFESFDGNNWIKLEIDDRSSTRYLSSHLSIEINRNIFIIGGNQGRCRSLNQGGGSANPTLKLSLPSGCAHVFQKNCRAVLTSSGSLFQYRQGRGIWKNNVLTMIGNSLFSFGTFHEQLKLDENDELYSSKVSNEAGKEQSVSMFYDAAVFDACLLPDKSSSISAPNGKARERDLQLEYSLKRIKI
ncbi:unnamed protein product [Oikopleura dioica]|uniref:Uncharacterized protein n=1 Tax=Oikopleura dioica TaxID=34765 RepID=E4YD18_OIKDI|nr:unnamed protein product [Oikopleura dioica]